MSWPSSVFYEVFGMRGVGFIGFQTEKNFVYNSRVAWFSCVPCGYSYFCAGNEQFFRCHAPRIVLELLNSSMERVLDLCSRD